jgi:tRNA threonylcarbamoyladenosine biosynthesis protein TsaB
MKILAVDTAADSCSVAVADSGYGILAEMTVDIRQTHSKHLMQMIITVLGMTGLRISDIDGFAVTRGPGSFTGLRIGISTVKGLAAGSGKPLTGVSSPDALAFQFPFADCLICTMTDARKKEVYCSRYRFENGRLKKEKEDQVLSPDKAVADIAEPCLFAGNGALIYQKQIAEILCKNARFAPPCLNIVRAGIVAQLGMQRLEKGDSDDVALFRPCYLRKSDAELNFGPKAVIVDNKFPA